ALLVDVEVFNTKRVVGLMPEASSFGGICISFLAGVYFFRRAIVNPFLRVTVTPVLLLGLALLVWLSTSSSAFVSLAVLGGVVLLEWAWRATSGGANAALKRGLSAEFTFAVVGLTALLM